MKKATPRHFIGLNLTPSLRPRHPAEEMWTIIQQQQDEISTLKKQLKQQRLTYNETEIVAEATISCCRKMSLTSPAQAKQPLVAMVNCTTTI